MPYVYGLGLALLIFILLAPPPAWSYDHLAEPIGGSGGGPFTTNCGVQSLVTTGLNQLEEVEVTL